MKYFRLFFGLIVFIIIGTIVFRTYFILNSTKSNKKVYEIQVNNFNTHESYLTYEFTKDPQTNCISFKDEFGIKRIVCNNYTITEY